MVSRKLAYTDAEKRGFASENSYCSYVKPAYTIKPYKHPRLKYVVRSKKDGTWVRKYFDQPR